MGLPPENDGAAVESCMRTDAMLGWPREDYLLHKTPTEIYHYFKAPRLAPASPMARVLAQGGTLLALAGIVCLFTITTW
jgi:hypothetical protein